MKLDKKKRKKNLNAERTETRTLETLRRIETSERNENRVSE